MSKCGQNFALTQSMNWGFLLYSVPPTQRLSVNHTMLRCCHVLFKDPTFDAVPNLLPQDPWGDSSPTNCWAGRSTLSPLQLHFYFQQYAQGPRWDSQRYDRLYSMKYSAGQCTLYFLQLYLVMSFLVVCGIAAVFSNNQYMQLLHVFWSVFITR